MKDEWKECNCEEIKNPYKDMSMSERLKLSRDEKFPDMDWMSEDEESEVFAWTPWRVLDSHYGVQLRTYNAYKQPNPPIQIQTLKTHDMHYTATVTLNYHQFIDL